MISHFSLDDDRVWFHSPHCHQREAGSWTCWIQI